MENYDEYTSNEEMDSFQGGDNTIVVTGAVVRDDPHRRRANAPQPRVRVLRVILSNMQGREMRVLFWDQRVAEFENRILRQIIRISGPRVVVANPLYVDLTQNLMSIELSIQQSTTVDILGPIPAVRGPALPMAPSVELRNAGNMLGQVQITAFIRHPIQRQIIGNFTSASGAITDGVYHLCVNVAVPSAQMIPAGSHVTILGELRRNNHDTLILQVTEMTNIQIVDEQIMDPAQLRNGFHIIPRIAAGEQLPAIPNAAPQMQRHQFNAPVINHGPQPVVQPQHQVALQPLHAGVQAQHQVAVPAVPAAPAALQLPHAGVQHQVAVPAAPAALQLPHAGVQHQVAVPAVPAAPAALQLPHAGVQPQHQLAVPAVPAAPAALQLPHAGVQPQHQLAVPVNSVQVHTSAVPEQAAVQLHVDPDNASALLVTNASQEHHQPSSFGNQLLNNNDDQHQFDLEFPPINIHKRKSEGNLNRENKHQLLSRKRVQPSILRSKKKIIKTQVNSDDDSSDYIIEPSQSILIEDSSSGESDCDGKRSSKSRDSSDDD